MTAKKNAILTPTFQDIGTNYTQVLTAHARTQPQTAALQIGERVLSYQMLDERVGRAAHWLQRQGVVQKEIVALQMREPVSLALALQNNKPSNIITSKKNLFMM